MKRDYTKLIEEYWPTIVRAWEEHGEKHSIIECDMACGKVSAMPARDYIDGLSERTREATLRQFTKITSQNGIMVFIRDSRNKVLQSHVFLPKNQTE